MTSGLSMIMGLIFWVNVIIGIGIATAAFVRFRATTAGLLIGGGYVAMTLGRIAIQIVHPMVLRSPGGHDMFLWVSTVSSLLMTGILAFVALGIGFIPRSLEKLGDVDGPPAGA